MARKVFDFSVNQRIEHVNDVMIACFTLCVSLSNVYDETRLLSQLSEEGL